MMSSDEDMSLSEISQRRKEESKSNKVTTKTVKSAKPKKSPASKASASNGTKKTKTNEGKAKPVKKITKAGEAEPKRKTTVKKETESGKNGTSTTAKKTKGSKQKIKEEEEQEEIKKMEAEDAAAEEDEKFRWWEDMDLDGEQKWETLSHNGVIFPPEYKPLPSHVKLYYDNVPVDLPLEAEEVAGFYGAMLETDHAKNPVFQKNFFEDFIQVLKESGGAHLGITDFNKCDFSKIHSYYQQEREKKKALSKEEKKALKAEKDKLEEPYKTCLLNGHKEQVGNFRIEPPDLFRGRGAHPKTGKLKRRVQPEDVTLNLSKDAKIPDPPPGHKWGEIRHDQTVTWLAMWKENIAGSFKYVRFAANSSVKGVSDYKKFETARMLKDHIVAIRKDYTKQLKDELMQNRQMATATYLIDVFALRAGGEKGEEEADTVGCCSLRYEHVTLKPPNIVIFDFLGKDSIRFYKEVEVDKQVFKNLKIFKKSPKQPGDDLFDRISPPLLNKHFQGYMKGLTAKVFRTYNASKTMQDQLDLIPNEGTVAEKVLKFNAANRTVAILCNHQRSIPKAHGSSIQKINDRLKEMIWQKIRLKRMILQIEPSLKKKDAKYFEEIDDLTNEEIEHIHNSIIEKQINAAKAKFQRDNEKLKAEGENELAESVLFEKLEKIEELRKEYANELKTKKPLVKKTDTVEKLKTQIEKIENRILNTTVQLKDKEDNSEVSLGTSKMNYIDPRLTVMFSKKYNVPIEKLFTKTLREKFTWAIESADENWRFY